MAHAEDLTPEGPRREPRAPSRGLRDETGRTPAREDAAAAMAAPPRRRANEIAARIGLAPITGLSGPDIFY